MTADHLHLTRSAPNSLDGTVHSQHRKAADEIVERLPRVLWRSDSDCTPCEEQQRAVEEVSAEPRSKTKAGRSHDYESVRREEDGRTHRCFLLGVPRADDREKRRRDASLDEAQKEPLRRTISSLLEGELARERRTCAMSPENEVQAGVAVTTMPQSRQ